MAVATTSLALKRNVTVNGYACQAWSEIIPHFHPWDNDAAWPGLGLDGVGNACANPDGHSAPWCYQMHPTNRWGECYSVCPSKATTKSNAILFPFCFLLLSFLLPMIEFGVNAKRC